VLRALKENARQGFWNGSLPPIGYRVVAAEQRGAKVKKKLEVDPLHAGTVRLIYRLALEGDGTSGPMGVKNITAHLNRQRIVTRDGGRWGIGQVHRILTRTTYVGRHEFNKRAKSKELKPVSEVIAVAVPPLIDQATFNAVQAHLRARNPKVTPARVVSGPTLLTGICFCADCGGAMTLRTGKGGRYRYYTCSIKARQGETDCKGRSIPMEKLDNLVAGHIEDRLLQPERLEEVLASVLDRRQERAERRREHIAELNKRAAETDIRLKRLYDAIETGVADLDDPALKERIAGLKAIRDQSQVDADRAQAMAESVGHQAITPAMVQKFARTARERIRIDGGGYRREHLRALAQRVEVADKEVRIMGSKSDLLRTLAAASGVKPATPGVRSSVPNWRAVHAVNLDGVFLGCRAAVRAMRPAGRGAIVNIASRSGLVGIPGACAYASSKAAIRNHTKSVALYCAEQGLAITCNAISPAAILTPMWEPLLAGFEGEALAQRMAHFVADTPLRRFGRVEEVAAVAVLLASGEASYMTGAEIVLDGGLLAGSVAVPARGDGSGGQNGEC
jgi:NAD(P)-dependent dehydrogenase (short-subunit alcohol dehydrogenase family)